MTIPSSPLTPHASLQGRKALVVGLGDTGLSCVRWLLAQGAEVRATDSRAEPPHAARLREAHPGVALRLGGFRAADFDWAELIVASPGVPVATPEIRAALQAGKPVVGDVELFARALARSRAKVLAITGSNGKSTVTSLAAHLCRTAGLKTVMAGNIGLPVLDALTEYEPQGRVSAQANAGAAGVKQSGWSQFEAEAPEVYVLELSSFQLETTTSLTPEAATVLNLSEDHMDRYAGMAEYAAAKARIFAGHGVQVLNRDDPLVMAMQRHGHRAYTFGLDAPAGFGHWGLLEEGSRKWLAEGNERLLPVDELTLAGLHNAANALAALALCRAIGLPYEPLIQGLRTFKGLPHRVEKVATVEGVTYYDDSKGTNVGATVAALHGFACPVVLIAGGDGKGQDFSPLNHAVRHARAVVLIGRDAPLIEAAVAGAVPVHRAASLEEAVRLAHAQARAGDAVLLSPACASFDMFRNYVHRAEVFVAAVRALAEAQGGAGVR